MSREERIEKERLDFNEWKSSISCSGNPSKGDDIWNVVMDGPEDSPYKGGKFKIKITFPSGYPGIKPEFEFLTPICHININGTHICIDSLNNYNSSSSIIELLSQIFVLLITPNEGSAYSKYSDLYINHYTEYLAEARKMTRENAMWYLNDK